MSTAKSRLLYLVRHGETEGESSIRFHGRNDVPLSGLGRQQMRSLATHLALTPMDGLVHSPLARARESAQILLEAMTHLPAVVEEAPDLIEVNFGAMEGLTQAEIAQSMPQWHAEWRAGRATAYPGGESFAGFAQRVAQAFDGMLARHPQGTLLVVAHKGVIRHGLAHLLGQTREAAAKMDFDLASMTVLSCGAETRIKHLNWTASKMAE